MVKVDVISGFLGAGKTTLIQKIFESVLKKEKVVLIENEFGEIGIDGTFLKESGIQIKEINAGCICCSLVGDFSASMKEVLDKYQPERIIIEPSGVGKLSDIVNAVLKLKEELQINILATVVDGPKTKMYIKNFGEFFLNQVEAANTIIISKTDKMEESKIIEVMDLIKERNNHAKIITTSIQELNSEELVKILEEKKSLKEELLSEMKEVHEHECCHGHHHHDEDEEHECCHEHHHHDADEVFTSWGKETPKAISYEELNSFLKALANDESLGMIIRSKGVLKASDNDKWYYYDFVSGDYDIRLGNPDYTGRIVVIGSKLNEEKIEALFYKKEI